MVLNLLIDNLEEVSENILSDTPKNEKIADAEWTRSNYFELEELTCMLLLDYRHPL